MFEVVCSSDSQTVGHEIISGSRQMIVEKNMKSNIQNKIYFRLRIIFTLVCSINKICFMAWQTMMQRNIKLHLSALQPDDTGAGM